MKNVLLALFLLMIGFVPVVRAEASKVQTSIGVRSGVYMSQNSINGRKYTSSHLAYDVDWLRHHKKLTWGLGPGSLSGVGNGYVRGGISTHVEMRAGLDIPVMRALSAGPGRNPSAMVLTMDLGLDGLSHRLRPASSPKGSEQLSTTTGRVLSMGIRYDF